jgi:hypothetical protein
MPPSYSSRRRIARTFCLLWGLPLGCCVPRRFEQFDERGLALRAEVAQQARVEFEERGVERLEQLQTLGRDARGDDAAVALLALALDQAATLQTVEQAGDVRVLREYGFLDRMSNGQRQALCRFKSKTAKRESSKIVH